MKAPVRAALALAATVAFATPGCSSSPAGHRAADNTQVESAKVMAAARTADAALAKLGIHHVFLVVLENESYHDSYVANPHPWLGQKLQQQGVLLTHYYGIGHHSLDNYLALISGQAPDKQTSADCGQYVDFKPRPATIRKQTGQAVGNGCVYPGNVPTLANQLTKTHQTWRGYLEDMGNKRSRETGRCGQPGSPAGNGTKDGTQGATRIDQYAARHNPFIYFHSVLDNGACKQNVVPLSALNADLKNVATTRHFSFVTPNLCDDGHDKPCVGKDAKGHNTGGLASVDHWLSVWVPRIEASPAFKQDGLLLIVTDESVSSDATACCNEQPGPNSSKPGVTGRGGGRIGALVIGHCVPKGKRVGAPYNHYSMLRTLEDLFGIKTGATDGYGHLGYASAPGLAPLGTKVFARC